MRTLTAICLAAVLASASPRAQGRTDYLNVESPQVHPIEIARVGGRDYVVTCNTRDSTIAIWDTDESLPVRLVDEIRVGLEPVSVRFHPGLSRLYTANFLGDSISVISLAAPAGPGSLEARLETTTWVGDEPLDIAFHSRGSRPTLFVTHMALDGFGHRDATTLEPIDGRALVPALVTVGFDTGPYPDGVPDEFVGLAAKEPRNVRVADDRLIVLAQKGGTNALGVIDFDLDYYCEDLSGGPASPRHVGGLGTTGLGMNLDGEGNLWVVGAEALDGELRGERKVREAPTGFTKSMLWRVHDPCGPSPAVAGRDVNRAAGPRAAPVPKERALSMLTDVVVFEPQDGPRKVFFTAFGNDRVGVVEPASGAAPEAWRVRTIDVRPVDGNPLAGPNGLAWKRADPAAHGDPGARLYVLNHLDQSVVTIDPVAERLVAGRAWSLGHDPRPPYLTTGQRFLYDAKLSGNGFVSCASCHIHGRTDRRAWDLGDAALDPVPIPELLPESIPDTEFASGKGPLLTQSLQGLLNFEVAPADLGWVTNAPYHWRGDRASFRDFNGAFRSLLGGEPLEDHEIAAFEEFVNSIHYPPNPKQPRDRAPSGEFGIGQDPHVDGSSGAQRGSKLFHSVPSMLGRSCASGCHAGAEGSTNRLTATGMGLDGEPGNPIEVAALRGLFQKESKRDVDGRSDPADSPYTGIEGLLHTGLEPNPGGIPGFPSPVRERNLTSSINAFNRVFFSNALCGQPGPICPDLEDVNQFVHEFDWGVGPLVGCAITLDAVGAGEVLPADPPRPSAGCGGACTDRLSTLDCMEQQAGAANVGIAVQAWTGNARRGFWFDPTRGRYVEEPPDGPALDRAGLVALLRTDTDRIVVQAVPLGDERRLASPRGPASTPAPGPPPKDLRLLPMVPNDFWKRIPGLEGGWADLSNATLQSLFIHTVRLYQWGLILEAPDESGFGLGDRLRHDVPRRFQVSGAHIRHGARLVLGYLDGPNGPPDPERSTAGMPLARITLPLYPTDRTDPANHDLPVWQTAVELEPLAYYSLMLGGSWAPGVTEAAVDQRPFTFAMTDVALDRPGPDRFDPLGWNWVVPVVLNDDGTSGDGGWQRLRIE